MGSGTFSPFQLLVWFDMIDMTTKANYLNVMGFAKKARLYQQWYKERKLGAKLMDEYTTMLTDEDAKAGGNFYVKWEGMLDSVGAYFKFDRNKKMYKNMLRSEHVPFNFFVPINDLKDRRETVAFLNDLLNRSDINSVEDVRIEFSPATKYLDDLTSFDAYISYRNSKNESCGLGIEVKYTEKSYPWGSTEKKRMCDSDGKSLYHKYTSNELFKADAASQLATVPMKQFWRNHLLGLAMKENGELADFTCVHLYPEGNEYQGKKSVEYANQLTDAGKQTFKPVTYEKFMSKARKNLGKVDGVEDWLDYLEERYIINDEVLENWLSKTS